MKTLLSLLIRFGVAAVIALIVLSDPPVAVRAAPEVQVVPAIVRVRTSNVRDVTFTVSWQTSLVADGRVRYGTSPSNLSLTASDDRGSTTQDDTHHVTITGLAPNTTYYFDVISGALTDNNGGAHYTQQTGPTLGPTAPDLIFGQVFEEDGQTIALGTLVYITLRDANGVGSSGSAITLSAYIDETGYWFTNLSDARVQSRNAYFQYSPEGGDQLYLEAEAANNGNITATVNTANDAPAPNLVLAPLAVTLADFSAAWSGEVVRVAWETASETNILGFNLYRATTPTGQRAQINEAMIPSEAPGQGGGAAYTFDDRTGTSGTTYYYWLESVDTTGHTTEYGPVSTDAPTALLLTTLNTQSSSIGTWVLGIGGVLLGSAVLVNNGYVERGSRCYKGRSICSSLCLHELQLKNCFSRMLHR